ncbi:MAG: hypothetical protein IJA43_02255 [Clostridia bacterium]|nr:hypothetical protein [Clostridia bacterium]
MTKETISIERRTYEVNGEKYYVLLIPENDRKVMSYYIQKDGYGIITHYLGETIENFNPNSTDNFLEANLTEIIDIAEFDIFLIESATETFIAGKNS